MKKEGKGKREEKKKMMKVREWGGRSSFHEGD
jgi:hypothetical protein